MVEHETKICAFQQYAERMSGAGTRFDKCVSKTFWLGRAECILVVVRMSKKAVWKLENLLGTVFRVLSVFS